MSVSELKEQLQSATDTLERIAQDAMSPAVVLGISAKTLRVAMGDSHVVIAKDTATSFKLGDAILVHHAQKAYIRHDEFKGASANKLYTVQDIIGDRAVIEVQGERRLVPFIIEDLRIGDRAILDNSLSIIMSITERQKKEFTAEETGVSWDDIGGNREAKEALIEAIEHPIRFAELYAHYGASAESGILLSGPPGCGKTMLAKAAATSINSYDGFIHCKGPEVLNAFVGESESTIRGLFGRAREFHGRTGRRAVIFIDEAEAILGARGQRYAMMEKTIVPTFLAEMDGMSETPATVILATNRPEDLDPAVVRSGRMDRRVEVKRPDQTDSVEIVMSHLKKAPTAGDKEDLAMSLVDEAFMATFTNQGEVKPLHTYVSGALFAGVVDKAKKIAMRRDIHNNTRDGVTKENLSQGLALELNEMRTIALS